MVLVWSAASEGSGTESEPLALNKRQTKTPGAALKSGLGMVHGRLGHPFSLGGPDYIS